MTIVESFLLYCSQYQTKLSHDACPFSIIVTHSRETLRSWATSLWVLPARQRMTRHHS